MATIELGTIKPVDVGRLWRGEGVEFARWLSENLQLLGAPLHMDLELVRLEPPAGWFWLNILAKEVGSNNLVAIALQSDHSRHDLLGSLLAYAAHHDARTLIWITPEFRTEHRETLEWLNQLTADDVEVYGVEALAIKIDKSPPGHEFRPVAFGDALAKRARIAASGLTPIAYRRMNFYQPLVEDLWREGFTNRTTARSGGGQSFPSGLPGVSYNAAFGWGKALVHIWISTGDQSRNVRIYDALLDHRSGLECELQDLKFDLIGELGGGSLVSAGMSRDGSLNSSEEELEETRNWMYDNLISLKTAFQPCLEKVMQALQEEEDAESRSAAGDESSLEAPMLALASPQAPTGSTPESEEHTSGAHHEEG